jgi:hypothetical protein
MRLPLSLTLSLPSAFPLFLTLLLSLRHQLPKGGRLLQEASPLLQARPIFSVRVRFAMLKVLNEHLLDLLPILPLHAPAGVAAASGYAPHSPVIGGSSPSTRYALQTRVCSLRAFLFYDSKVSLLLSLLCETVN